jgi:hypothetical protein
VAFILRPKATTRLVIKIVFFMEFLPPYDFPKCTPAGSAQRVATDADSLAGADATGC